MAESTIFTLTIVGVHSTTPQDAAPKRMNIITEYNILHFELGKMAYWSRKIRYDGMTFEGKNIRHKLVLELAITNFLI